MPYDIRDMSHIGEISVNHPRHLVNVVDLSATGWKEAGSHEVFTVTGLVLFRTWVACTSSVTGGGNIKYGVESGVYGDVGSFMAETGPMTSVFVAGRFFDNTVSDAAEFNANALGVMPQTIIYNSDVGYTIVGAAPSAGTLEFHCIWEPLTAGASVVIGAGGSL